MRRLTPAEQELLQRGARAILLRRLRAEGLSLAEARRLVGSPEQHPFAAANRRLRRLATAARGMLTGEDNWCSDDEEEGGAHESGR